ncbi:polysaccharide deacetylase family protein [Dactylosporangium sp. CA-052675]|uniref:polysaccharide deacetylase family protein n=1 Tax=Dactylosporangium sp. CA-052675 TaxID=3239927 RepID=UPI003D8C90DC
MVFAGVAWTADGYEIEVAGEDGRTLARQRARTPGEVVAALLAVGRDVAVVFDSTNGTVEGGLLGAGFPVYRADPDQLPGRPAFGSVTAAALADAGRRRASGLARLAPGGGALDGRGEEYSRGIAASAAAEAALARAGRFLAHGARDRPQIALTFDDGPCPPYTRGILGVLARYDVRATFFCVGLHAAAHPDEVARIVDSGHLVANHSWSHPFLPDLSRPELAGQVERTDEALARAGAAASVYFRPPYGSRTPEVLGWLAAQGSVVTLWDVESGDWACPGADAIARRTLDKATAGSIVLLHDGGGDRSQTVQALPAIVESLLSDGYDLVTVDGLGQALS